MLSIEMLETLSEREKEVLEKIIQVLKKHFAPNKIILFGSRAKGKSQKGADFDLAIDQERPGISEETEMKEELEKVSGLYDVDVVYLKSVDRDFKEIVLETGTVIVVRPSHAK